MSPSRHRARALTCGRSELSSTAFWASSAASFKRPAARQHLRLRQPVMALPRLEADGLGAGGRAFSYSPKEASTRQRSQCARRWWPGAARPGRGRGG